MDYGKMEFTFATGGERDAFVRQATDTIRKYGRVTMCDLLGTMGNPCRFTDQYCGWDSIRDWMYSTDFMVERPFIITTPAPTRLPYKKLKRIAELYKYGPNNESKPGNNVNHPDHYQSEGGLEVIDVIAQFTKGLDGVEAFAIGNAIKYLCRWSKKNGVEDLKKAQWYLDYVVKYREDAKVDEMDACYVPDTEETTA